MRIFKNTQLYTAIASLILICISASSSNAAFSTVSMRGKQYVSVNSIKTAYQFTSFRVSGNSASLSKKGVKLDFNAGSSYVTINTLKFVFSFPIIKSGSSMYISETDTMKVLDPIMRPSHISAAKTFKTVIIDPGHGGKDVGAVNGYGTEAGYNLIVAKIVKKNLEAKGFRVIMTRETNVYLSLQQRVTLANRYKDAIFVSIHFNAASNSRASGIETFTLSPKGVAHYGRGVKRSDHATKAGNHQDSANIALACAIHCRMIHRTKAAKVDDRGIKRARFSVLSSIKHPAILVEGGFMSNAAEAKWIDKPIYQNSVAVAISEGIFNYKRALNCR